MRTLPLPPSGPIHLDCREQSALAIVRNLEDTLRRMRPGPRVFHVRIATTDQLDVVTRWARGGRAPHEIVPTVRGPEVRVYLLPTDLGGHPIQGFHKPLSLSSVVGERAGAENQPAA